LIERNKKEDFLFSLEEWISEVVKEKSNGENNKIAPFILEGFDRSMQANIDYHRATAAALAGNGNSKLVSYHNLMSEAYRALLA